MSVGMRTSEETSTPRGWLDRIGARSIAGRINLLIAFAIFCQVSIVAYQLYEYRDSVWDQRRHELTNLGSVALSIVNSEYAAAQSGQQSEEAAKAHAMQRLGALRYNTNDYFWINDLHPRMIMHPIKPELNDKDLTDFKDPDGKHFFLEMVEVAQREGTGFVAYNWPKPGKDAPQPKLSYVAEFKPWGWVVGTGVYVDDLNEMFMAQVKAEGVMVLGVIALCLIVSLAIGRGLARSIIDMSVTMEQLAAGRLDTPIETGEQARELERMNRALLVFQREAIEKIEIEAAARRRTRSRRGPAPQGRRGRHRRRTQARHRLIRNRARQACGQGSELSARGRSARGLSEAARRLQSRAQRNRNRDAPRALERRHDRGRNPADNLGLRRPFAQNRAAGLEPRGIDCGDGGICERRQQYRGFLNEDSGHHFFRQGRRRQEHRNRQEDGRRHGRHHAIPRSRSAGSSA